MIAYPFVRLREWIETFRFLHEKARVGRLGEEELTTYRGLREEFASLLLAAQCLTVAPGYIARGALRAVRPLPLQLLLPSGPLRASALDISAGGFSSFLPVAVQAGERIEFKLGLSTGDVAGRARVVNIVDESTAYRVSFALEGMSKADVERMETEVIDAALQQFDFFKTHG